MNLPKITFSSSQFLANDATHGTSEENAVRILKEGFTRRSNENAWLGAGYYFFHGEPAFDEARGWAEKQYREGRLSAPLALLKAVIDLGRCLDYDDPQFVDLLPKVADALHRRGELKLAGRPADAAVVSVIAKFYDLDTVRAKRYTGKAFAESHFLSVPVTYLCVIKREKILDVTLAFTWSP